MFGIGKANAAIDTFVAENCADLMKRFPPERDLKLPDGARKAQLTLEKAFLDFQQRMVQFQIDHKLGVYGKARLLRGVQDHLQAAKYTKEFVEAVVDVLVPATAVKRR
jgi:hypothetical protein